MADALQRLLARQGAVGGASAGASLLCALCPNFDEIMEGLDLIPGLVLSHVLRRDRQDRLAAIADCFRGMWCWGLDEAAGLVLMGNQLHVTCRSPVLAVRHDESACMACLLVPGFQGSLEEVEKQMKEFQSIHWHPEQVMAKGTELWSVHWSGQHALADGPIQGVETNGNFQGVESHQFLSWKLPMEDASALVFGSHYHLSITFDLEDLPLICCLLLVQCAGPGDEAEIQLNEHLLQGDGRQWMLPYKFQVKTYHLPMGTLRLGSNTLRVAMQDVKSQYCLLSATLLDEGEQEMVQQILPSTVEPALPRRRSSDSSSSTPRWGYLHRGASETEDEHEEPVRLNIYDLGKSNTVQSLNGWLKADEVEHFLQLIGLPKEQISKIFQHGNWMDEQIQYEEFLGFVFGEATIPKLPLAPGTAIEDLWPDLSLYQRQSKTVIRPWISCSEIAKILPEEFERLTEPRPFSICLAGKYQLGIPGISERDEGCAVVHNPESIEVSPSGSVSWTSAYQEYETPEGLSYKTCPEISSLQVKSVSRSLDDWTVKLHPGEEPRIEVSYPPLCVLQLSNGKSVDLSQCGFCGQSALLSSTKISYHGKIKETEGSECIVSFPGRYADGWRECVEASAHDMGVACVFLCGKDDGFGEHAIDPDAGGSICYCHKIYGQRDFKLFGYETEEECIANGNRPTWGCLWFQKWRNNVEVAVKRKQRLVAYFFVGQVGQGLVAWDDLATADLWAGRGLGGSQKGELAFLQKMGYEFEMRDPGKSNTVQSLNGWLKPVGIGAFHCAVQVYGVEWSYGGWLEEGHMEDDDATGIWSCLPQMSGDHTFREAVPMGSISFSEEDTVELIYSLMEEWPMSEYDILNKNCCHFCEELCQLLGLGPLPSRVKKLAGLGATLNESAHVAADQVFQVASKVTSDIVGAGYVATNLAVQAALSGASALADAPRRLYCCGCMFGQNSLGELSWGPDYLHRAGRTARYGEPGKVTSLVRKGDKALAKGIERSVQLGKPINELSADKRDYLRGGALGELMERHPRAAKTMSPEERGRPPNKPYRGGLR
eukprot:symbB.v1.2.033176.t2/scaffold4088.1/size44913/3